MAGLHKHYRQLTEPAGQARHAARLGGTLPVKLFVFRMLGWIIGAFASRGSLRLNYHGLEEMVFGDGSGPDFTVRLNSLRTIFRIVRDPELGCGECYMEGGWALERGDLGGFLKMMCRNQAAAEESIPGKTLRAIGALLSVGRANSPRTSRRNVAHHYDIGNDLYRAFLDEGLNYSCAFFEEPDQTLRAAQLNKLRTTIRRLDIQPGARVLDIGSGWGELTRLISAETGAARVTGITLARTQLELARKHAAAMREPRPEYRLVDYRYHAADNSLAYDRIVSIGMFEHVGTGHFNEYFAAVRRMLSDDGLALIHSIMRRERSETSSWTRKYIFPGGYIPTLDDTIAAARKAGLELAHEPFVHESFHYAETLRRWRRNFNDAWPGLDRRRYDERFRRMWNFYLAGSEAAFDENGMFVAQILLRKRG